MLKLNYRCELGLPAFKARMLLNTDPQRMYNFHRPSLVPALRTFARYVNAS